MIDKFEIKLGEEAIGKRIRAILGVPEAILTNEIISSSIFKKQAENFINKNIAEFLELIDIEKINKEKYKEERKKYGYLLSQKVLTIDEEYEMFVSFYHNILSNVDYPNYEIGIARKIAYDRTYNYSKYTLYKNVDQELKKISEKYKLILLTDNWPSVLEYLRKYKLNNYFDKVYVSSIYGCEKKDKVFFDYPIKEYNVKPGEALFIDDNEDNLDIAKEKGFDVLLMDRDKKISDNKYEIINDLFDL